MQSTRLAPVATTLIWTLIGAIMGIALVGVHFATAQSRVAVSQPAVDGWRVSARYDQKIWPEMKFSVSIENTEKKAREAQMSAKLVRTEFKGDPNSRVMRPGDRVEKEISVVSLGGKVDAGKTRVWTVSFKHRPEAAEKPGIGMPRITYMVSIESDGKVLERIGAHPAATEARATRRAR